MYICKICGKEYAKKPDKCDNCGTNVTPETFIIEHKHPKIQHDSIALKHAKNYKSFSNLK